MKSGKLYFLEPSGPLQACNGTALPVSKPFDNAIFKVIGATPLYRLDLISGNFKVS
jgi:hypothetical protein